MLGDQVSAPEIAALVYTSGQQDSGKRTAVTYPVNSPDHKHRFLPPMERSVCDTTVSVVVPSR